MLAGGIDVEEDALGIADVAAVEQWGIQGVEDGILNSAFSARPAHRHDGTAAALDGGLDVTEVEIDGSFYGNQLRDALGGIAQYLVCQFEGILYGNFRIGIYIAKSLVVDNEQGIYVLAHLFYTLQGLHDFLTLFKIKWDGDDAHRQDAHAFGDACDDGCSSCTGSATHAGCNECHLGSVIQQSLDVFLGVLRFASSDFRVSTCSQTALSEHDFYRHW